MLVINLLFMVLTYLAVPVILIALYDHYVLAPRRPKNADGQPLPDMTITFLKKKR